MPSSAPGHEPADLLLCGHHYRTSRHALEQAGATVFDAAGTLIMPHDWDLDVDLDLEQFGVSATR